MQEIGVSNPLPVRLESLTYARRQTLTAPAIVPTMAGKFLCVRPFATALGGSLMPTSALISRVNRSIALSALLAFTTLGLFGQSLHSLLPCSDGTCGVHANAAEESACSCGHSHHAVTKKAAAEGEEAGAQMSAAGHDAANCALCTLLAKIKVDRPALFHAQVDVAYCQQFVMLGESLLPQDLALAGAPRGPPLA